MKHLVSLFVAMAMLPAGAQSQTADSGAFFVRLGRDTVAVERYVRTPQQLIADALLRTPETRAMKLTVTFNDKGGVSWYEVVNNPVGGVPHAAPVLRTVVTYINDTAQIEAWRMAVPLTPRKVAVKSNMLPLQLPFYSLYETALMRARKTKPDTLNMLAASGVFPYALRWLPGDSVTLTNAGYPLLARLDKADRLLSMSGAQTTFKVEVTRARWLDLDPLARRYAQADSLGKGIGALSPRDSMEAVVAGGDAMLAYGRPSKRGRVIFGGLVPWGHVWRTGANQATSLELQYDVEINGVTVPAGKYTIWTIPDPKQWTLIINKQTGQWGTAYDARQDLVRIPVKSETLVKPVETFTIAFKPAPTETLMTLSWDRTRVLIPIKPHK